MSFSKCSNVILRGQNVIFEGGKGGGRRGEGRGKERGNEAEGYGPEGLEILSNTNVVENLQEDVTFGNF